MKHYEFNEICKILYHSTNHHQRMFLLGDILEIFVDKMEDQDTWDAFDEMRSLIRMLKEVVDIMPLTYQIQMNANAKNEDFHHGSLAQNFGYLMYLLRRYTENICVEQFSMILGHLSLIASGLMNMDWETGRAFVINILQSRVQFRTL